MDYVQDQTNAPALLVGKVTNVKQVNLTHRFRVSLGYLPLTDNVIRYIQNGSLGGQGSLCNTFPFDETE